MTSPLAKNLFHKALAESGASFTRPLLPLSPAEHAGAALAKALGAPAGDGQIKYLRALSAQEMLAAQAKIPAANRSRIGPDVDGYVIAQQPALVFATGQAAAIPFVVRRNRHRGRGRLSVVGFKRIRDFPRRRFPKNCSRLRRTIFKGQSRTGD